MEENGRGGKKRQEIDLLLEIGMHAYHKPRPISNAARKNKKIEIWPADGSGDLLVTIGPGRCRGPAASPQARILPEMWSRNSTKRPTRNSTEGRTRNPTEGRTRKSTEGPTRNSAEGGTRNSTEAAARMKSGRRQNAVRPQRQSRIGLRDESGSA